MEVEQMEDSSNTPANGSTISGKRGRGRPRGSLNKKVISEKEISLSARASKKVDFFSPEIVMRPKVKKRGRPKKIRIPGRPRKIPLTPEEEAERILRLSKKRKLTKPLGRPRIHPLVNMPKEKRGRGRPRKYESVPSQNGRFDRNLKSVKLTESGGDTPRRSGRPSGSFKKKRGRPSGSSPLKRSQTGTPGNKWQPPGSGNELKVSLNENGTSQKQGRLLGSGRKRGLISGETNGTPKKRGRPSGSGANAKAATQVTDGIPKKRGRPSSSGCKFKGLLQETNGSAQKRGRRSGSGRVESIRGEAEHFLVNSAFSADTSPHKRGRPKNSEAFGTIQTSEEGKSKENDEPSLKTPCHTFSSNKYSSKPDADGQKANDNYDHEAAMGENPILSAGSIIKPESVGEHKFDNTALNENNGRKNPSTRGGGKSQKKK